MADIEYSWVGSKENFVDKVNIKNFHNTVLGRFGGNSTSGQYKNEDGCMNWINLKDGWEFAVLLDAHHSAESAELVLHTIESLKEDIESSLKQSVKEAFQNVSKILLNTFQSEGFLSSCKKIKGETAFLCVIRKDKFLWWLSIGDCSLYLFHPELAALDEYLQNHRSFFEWIGNVNTFNLPVPCYSTGTKELRKGRNHIFMTTDGLVECPESSFSNPEEILKCFSKNDNGRGVEELLLDIQKKNVRDSTTIISWIVVVEQNATQASPA